MEQPQQKWNTLRPKSLKKLTITMGIGQLIELDLEILLFMRKC